MLSFRQSATRPENLDKTDLNTAVQFQELVLYSLKVTGKKGTFMAVASAGLTALLIMSKGRWEIFSVGGALGFSAMLPIIFTGIYAGAMAAHGVRVHERIPADVRQRCQRRTFFFMSTGFIYAAVPAVAFHDPSLLFWSFFTLATMGTYGFLLGYDQQRLLSGRETLFT